MFRLPPNEKKVNPTLNRQKKNYPHLNWKNNFKYFKKWRRT